LALLLSRDSFEDDPKPVPILGPKHAGLILVSVALISIIGLLTVFIGIGVLATQPSRISDHDLAPMLFFLGAAGLATICIIVGMLLRMLRPLRSQVTVEEAKKQKNKYLRAPQKAELPPQSVESVASVIEHTTHRLPDYDPPKVAQKEPQRHTK